VRRKSLSPSIGKERKDPGGVESIFPLFQAASMDCILYYIITYEYNLV